MSSYDSGAKPFSGVFDPTLNFPMSNFLPPRKTAHADFPDGLLEDFVRLLDQNPEILFSVELLVGSVVFCGELISGSKYISLLHRDLTQKLKPEGVSWWTERLAERATHYNDVASGEKAEHDPTYAHLRHVTIVGPAGDMRVKPLWRVRLTQVAGFSIGLSADAESPALSIGFTGRNE